MSLKDTRQKILAKIRKLLAMSEDVGSPNEAATAARMAKKMMEEHNVDHAEAIYSEMSLDDLAAHTHGEAYARFPAYLSTLAVAVATYCDCRARFECSYGRAKSGRPATIKQIIFEGELTDLEICKYLYTYLYRTIDRLVKKSPHNKYIGPRTSFRIACVHELAKRLREMKREETEQARTETDANSFALVMVDKKLSLLNEKFGVVKYGRSKSRYSSPEGAREGAAAGAGIGIRKAVNSGASVKRLSK